jgi:hypothetical protein
MLLNIKNDLSLAIEGNARSSIVFIEVIANTLIGA